MIEIGPNLLAAILALISLLTAVVAVWRASAAHDSASEANRGVASNQKRLDVIEQNNNLGGVGGKPV
jgi:hypothetical protein